MTYYLQHASPLGILVLAANDRGLCGVYFEEEHKYFKGVSDWHPAQSHDLLNRAASQLDEYFARQRTQFDLPLDLCGTPFQRKVWEALIAIPWGHTRSYAQHAQHIGSPKALRAVGAAIGRNPVSIVVPCHRVIGASRALTGYAAGLACKQALLALEGIDSIST